VIHRLVGYATHHDSACLSIRVPRR
jgi:hypothetical protein